MSGGSNRAGSGHETHGAGEKCGEEDRHATTGVGRCARGRRDDDFSISISSLAGSCHQDCGCTSRNVRTTRHAIRDNNQSSAAVCRGSPAFA
eukprot:6176830-Pleurochrysis_carterae.AAC.1